MSSIENIDFSKIKQYLSKEDKYNLALEFISSEYQMWNYDGSDHPAVYLHRFVFNLFCKEGVNQDDFLRHIVKLFQDERKDLIPFIIEQSKEFIDID